jgi:hypothetical protein
MHTIKVRSGVVLFVSTLIPLIFFLIFDFFWGSYFPITSKRLSDDKKPYLQLNNGWYELKSNFIGKDQYGPNIFPVMTNDYGFRKGPNSPNGGKHEFIFLGDSFTYGINGAWNETFVGIFEAQTGKMVLNAGVSSYSPSAYLFQYKKALKNGALSAKHTVIVALDISDVQDEAAFWTWDQQNSMHPIKIGSHQSNEKGNQLTSQGLRKKFYNNFPLTSGMYKFVRYEFFANSSPPLLAETLSQARSSFTWQDWSLLDQNRPGDTPGSYAPLGVEKGLIKIEDALREIVNLANQSSSNVYFLIYPWPAQIVYQDKFNWSKWVQYQCLKLDCAGVVDTIPYFRRISKDTNWYYDFYLIGDSHFNERGNQIIASQLLEAVISKK